MPSLFKVTSLLGLLLIAEFRVQAQSTSGQTYILAASGDKTPDGQDTIQVPDSFALSSTGAVFQASLTNAQLSAVFAATPVGKTEIMRVGNQFAGGTLASFAGNIWTNVNNQALIYGFLADGAGTTRDALLVGSSPTNTKAIVVADQTTPDGNGQFNSFSAGTLNDAGQIAFWGAIKNGGGPLISTNGVYRWLPDGTITQLLRSGQQAPGETNQIYSTGGGFINQAGQVSFSATITDAQASGGYAYALYRATSATDTVRLARSNQPAPSTGYLIYNPQFGSMNNSGTASFFTYLSDSTGTVKARGIFKAAGSSAVVPIVFTGQTAPGSLGVYTDLDNTIGINDAGQVAYVGSFKKGSATSSGVFIGDGTTQRCLVQAGQTSPDGYKYNYFGLARATGDGTVVFAAATGTTKSGYDSIYLTDGTDTVKVVHTGDTVSGGKINQVGFDPKAVNDLRQVTYQGGADENNLKILLFAPSLNWRKGGDGNWSDSANWTASLVPATNNDVSLSPSGGGHITGPATATTVRSLKVGAAMSGTAELGLRVGTITAAGGVTVAPLGRLTGTGRVVGNVVNQAVVAPGISVGTLTVQGDYTQASTGGLEIDVAGSAATACDSLAVTGSTALHGTLKLGLTTDAANQLQPTDTLTILSSTGTLTGAFSNAANGARLTTSDGYGSFVVNYTAHAVVLSSFVATDSDGDGVPDAWTQQYFGHASGLASDRSRAWDDADGDGISNLAEYLAGTNPLDGSSALRATMSFSNKALAITFPTVAGRTYSVESSTQLGAGSWLPSVTGIVGDGTTKMVSLAAPSSSSTAGFYRVSVSR